jgi:putative hydrolase of the HAD superfamily
VKRIAAMTFDAGGTLFSVSEPVGETYARLARRAGIEVRPGPLEIGFELAFTTAPPLVAPSGSTEPDRLRAERAWWHDVVRSTLAHALAGVGAMPSPEIFEGFFEATFAHYAVPGAWRVHDDVADCIDGLTGLGLEIGVLSNFDSRLHGVVAGLGLPFRPVLASTEIGHAKPAREAFAAAATALGRGPSSCLHVGDSLEADALGARSAGWAGVWLDRDGRGETSPAGVWRIRSLRELPALLAEIGG